MISGKSLSRNLDLNTLKEGLPSVTSEFGTCCAQAATICLEDQGHPLITDLIIRGNLSENCKLIRLEVTNQMQLCWNDEQVTTEHGAYGVAFLIIRDLTEFTIIERARKGPGFDYWLGYEDELPFQNKAKLEVSGIRNGVESDIKIRVKQKKKQTEKAGKSLPIYIIVVEFSRPIAQMEQK